MPRKFLDSDKQKWLDLYEGGKTEIQIAKEHAKCDVRTIRKGIEEARRRQDAKVARVELLKEALHKHQDRLQKELDDILLELTLPSEGYVLLPWHRGGDLILAESETVASKKQTGHSLGSAPASRSAIGTVRRLLKEHLKNDRLWKVIDQYQKAYTDHLAARVVLQRKTVAVIQEKTGCKLVDSNNGPRPFVYSGNTGDLFLRTAIRQASGVHNKSDIESEFVTNTTNGDVRCQSMVLAEAPGNEEKIKQGLLDALKELKESSEAVSVVETAKTLEEAAMRVRQAVEQIKLLCLIPGQCEICRRLGI